MELRITNPEENGFLKEEPRGSQIMGCCKSAGL